MGIDVPSWISFLNFLLLLVIVVLVAAVHVRMQRAERRLAGIMTESKLAHAQGAVVGSKVDLAAGDIKEKIEVLAEGVAAATKPPEPPWQPGDPDRRAGS